MAKKKDKPSITEEATKRLFLIELSATGLFVKAAESVGLTAEPIRQYRKRHPEFEERVAQALELHQATIETEIHRRAILGVERPVFYQGEECGRITEFSDRMLELYAKRHIPAYRDHSQVDMNVKGGVLVVPGVAANSRDWEHAQTDARVDPAQKA